MKKVIPVALAATAVLAAALMGQIPLPGTQNTKVQPGTPAPREDRPGANPDATKAPPKSTSPDAPPAAEISSDDPTFGTGITVILVPTTVTDKRGNTINGLRPEDFTLYDNDTIQEINRDVAFLPLSMVICIQRSHHVEAMLPKIQRMGNVMRDLLIGQDGEAALIAFDHRVDVIQDFTNDADKINTAIAALTPRGMNSRLNDAVNQATFMLRNKKDRRKVILLISETLDRSSEAGAREIATNLQVHNIDVYTINISRLVTLTTARPEVPRPDPFPPGSRPRPGVAAPDPTTQNQIAGTQGYGADFVPAVEEIFRGVKGLFIRNPAELYTKFTGGRELTFVTQNDLETAINNIGSEIRSQYILSYSPNNKMEGGFHKIKVQVNRPDLRIRTRPGYWMAAVPGQ